MNKSRYEVKGVYPTLDELLALNYHTNQLTLDKVKRTASSSGNWETKVKGRGLDFAEVRLYQQGDDVRNIDWRVTAKTQKTHTRLFTQEKERPIILAADLRSDMFFGSVNCFKSVSCAVILSALSWVALKSRDKVGGIIIGDTEHVEIRPQTNRRGVLSYINFLQDYCQKLSSPVFKGQKQTLDQLFLKLLRIAKPGSAVYVASDFHDIENVNIGRLSRLSQHCQITFITISDPLEWQLPNKSSLYVSDGIRSSELLTGEHHFMKSRFDKLVAITQPLNIEVLPLSTSDNVLSVIEDRFSKKHNPYKQRKNGR